MSVWPASNDYTIAIQSPDLCFRDPDLRAATLERTARTGMPKVWSGNFAHVYALRRTSRWAVKCFTRSAEDLRGRYQKIAKAISRSGLPYFVEFAFLDAEMLVNGTRYPVVKMQWADGQPLDEFVAANLGRPGALLETAARLRDLVRDLECKKLAHGDLQHGNILVCGGGLRLLDYDGLFVPAFAGTPSPENGVPAYQHPARTASDYGIGLDRFSLLVICTALSALAIEPRLWEQFNTGDNLIFTGDDFGNPGGSAVFRRLGGIPDPQVRSCLLALRTACGQPPRAVPFFSGRLSLIPGPRHGFWWVAQSVESATVAPEATRDKRFRPTHAAILIAVAVAAVASAGYIGLTAGFAVAVCAVAGYMIAEFARFTALPSTRRWLELKALVSRLEQGRGNGTVVGSQGSFVATIRFKRGRSDGTRWNGAFRGLLGSLVAFRVGWSSKGSMGSKGSVGSRGSMGS